MIAALVIARVNLLRVVRDRANLFFVFLLPLIIIVALGTAFGGTSSSRLGVVRGDAGALGEELLELITAGDLAVDVRERSSLAELEDGVATGELQGGLFIAAGYDTDIRTGQRVELLLVARPEDRLGVLRQGVETAVARQSALVRAAQLAADRTGRSMDDTLAVARGLQGATPSISVATTVVGAASPLERTDMFALGAQSQTILFMFLTSLTAATQLILTRQLGVSRRMLATPTPLRSILAGELTGRFAVAMLQGLFIVVVSSVVFGVRWGDLPAAAIVIVLFALVATGAAMLVGVFAGNTDQASALGVLLGLVLGALGGAMVPLELFPPAMATLARLTPHAWALEALRSLAGEGAGLLDILAQLSVLVVYAAVLVVVGTWGLRRSLTRG
jgi:ABC-2 type transport system permease protein